MKYIFDQDKNKLVEKNTTRKIHMQ